MCVCVCVCVSPPACASFPPPHPTPLGHQKITCHQILGGSFPNINNSVGLKRKKWKSNIRLQK